MKPQPTEEEIQFILDSISEFLRVKVTAWCVLRSLATCLCMCAACICRKWAGLKFGRYVVLGLLPGKALPVGAPAS